MDQNRTDMYFMQNAKYFPEERIMFLRERILAMDDNRFSMLSMIELKDPSTMLIISIFLGTLGIDRFMLGDVGMGVLKLLTGGLCGILTIMDWFSITNKTKEVNFNKIMSMI